MGTTASPKTQKSGGFDQLQCRVLYPVDVPGEDGLRGSLKRESCKQKSSPKMKNFEEGEKGNNKPSLQKRIFCRLNEP
jgi:hypothetical protein